MIYLANNSYTQSRQAGVILFFTLIALLVISLAAVALIRSVDTGSLIAGNIAFKQSTTSAAENSIQDAITWLAQTEATAKTGGKDVLTDSTHPFNVDDITHGYYSSFNPNMSLTDMSAASHVSWTNGVDSNCSAQDSNGITTCYIIQRMCPYANTPISYQGTDRCLTGSMQVSSDAANVQSYDQVCTGNCSSAGSSPLLRITVRSTGERSSSSYIQGFVN